LDCETKYFYHGRWFYPQGDIRRDKDLVFLYRDKHRITSSLTMVIGFHCCRMGMACQFGFGWNRNGVGPYSLSLGTKYLTQVGNLEAQETAVVDESSYSTLFKI
jgi:POT family proton-dependent oligopeptide transporter